MRDKEIQKLKINEVNLKSKATDNSQQHDYKNAELRREADGKQPKLEGDVEKHLKTQFTNKLDIAVAGTSKKAMENPIPKNTNLNSLFTKPFIQKTQIVETSTPQTITYAASINKQKQVYNHISNIFV